MSRPPNDAGRIDAVLGREPQVVKRAIREFWAPGRTEAGGPRVPSGLHWP